MMHLEIPIELASGLLHREWDLRKIIFVVFLGSYIYSCNETVYQLASMWIKFAIIIICCAMIAMFYFMVFILAHLSWTFLIACRPSVRKLLTFSSSSPKPMGQFQPNLVQSILGWREFKFVRMKDHALLQGEIIKKKRKFIGEIKKIFFSRTTGPISTKLGTMHPWMKGIQVCEEPLNSHEVYDGFFLLLMNVIV